MTDKNSNNRWLVLGLLVFIAALSRLIPHAFGAAHLFNFSPVGALALFGGAYFHKNLTGFILPFAALWLSNVMLDNLFFAQYYDGFVWFANWEVYLAFALIVVLGTILLRKISLLRLAGASLGASVLFFLTTNFFVWANGTMYAKSMEGLVTCYVAAIPFFWNTVAGDLFYVAILFGVFEWAQRRYPSLVLKTA
ncbi:MAG: hypothetical protein H6577_13865 [Lewinellaceae bacterium]|nr:hypothetical protein [Saprospiraceae bacterium]MCB9339213.1 hypothetical protein [Lewinellaceae bacterium]